MAARPPESHGSTPTSTLMSRNSRLCALCDLMLRNKPGSGKQYAQQSAADFIGAAKLGCYVCGWLVLKTEPGVFNKLHTNIRRTYQLITKDYLWIQVEGVGTEGFFLDKRGGGALGVSSNHSSPQSTQPYPINLSDPYTSPTPTGLSNEVSVKLATRWVKECRDHHQHCRPGDDTFLPTRLIQIIDTESVKLVLSTDVNLHGTSGYAALSHRWGGSKMLKLLEKNQKQLSTNIKVKDLPQTYQQGIQTCLKLDFQFIWIDSLCIIQDSNEDWQREAALMGSVYGNAALNICMGGAASLETSHIVSYTGLIKPLVITIPYDGGEEQRVRVTSQHVFFYDIRDSPLRQRGWIFQEWFLAKRTLVFSRMQLWWHCCEQLSCEDFPEGIPDNSRFGLSLGLAKSMKHSAIFTESKEEGRDYHNEDTHSSHELWWSVVKQYAKTDLTFEKDRVIAFSGVAQAFRNSQNLSSQYLAGIWRCDLQRGLSWYRLPLNTQSREVSRSPNYKAPSWSWMSLDGPFSFYNHFFAEAQWCFSVQEVYYHLVDETHETGLVSGGGLKVHGYLLGPLAVDADGTIQDDGVIDTHIYNEDIHSGDRSSFFKKHIDEIDPNGCSMLSYLDNLDLTTCQQGLVNGASRKFLPLCKAGGSIFYFPTSYENHFYTRVYGLILYRALDQPDVYHRVGFYTVNKPIRQNLLEGLQAYTTPQSILIL